MPSLDRFRRVAGRFRPLPGKFGLRPYRVYTVRRQWDGEHTGDGARYETATEIVEADGQPPKVRFANQETIAIQQIPDGSITVGPITPDHTGGGTSYEALKQLTDRGDEAMLRIVGPAGSRLYRVTGIDTDRALHWTVRAAPVGSE